MIDLAHLHPLKAEDLPTVAPDDRPCELVAGSLVCEPPPGQEHGWIAATLLGHLFAHVQRHGGGRVYTAETGFVLSRNPDCVRCPDAAFVADRRLSPAARSTLYFEGAPDLAVEVLSPSNTKAYTDEKVRDYLRAGSRLVWVIDPRAEWITVHRPSHAPRTVPRGGLLDADPVLPGFRLPLASLFDG